MFNHLRVARGLCAAGVMFTLGGASLSLLGSTAYAALLLRASRSRLAIPTIRRRDTRVIPAATATTSSSTGYRPPPEPPSTPPTSGRS